MVLNVGNLYSSCSKIITYVEQGQEIAAAPKNRENPQTCDYLIIKRTSISIEHVEEIPLNNEGLKKVNHVANRHTIRNFFRSCPRPISLKVAKPLLISNLTERATLTARSSGIFTSGMLGGDLKKLQDRNYSHKLNIFTIYAFHKLNILQPQA